MILGIREIVVAARGANTPAASPLRSSSGAATDADRGRQSTT
jgi:hypothetical protein